MWIDCVRLYRLRIASINGASSPSRRTQRLSDASQPTRPAAEPDVSGRISALPDTLLIGQERELKQFRGGAVLNENNMVRVMETLASFSA